MNAPGTPDLSLGDAQQAFIDGLSEKLEREALRPDEATAIVIARTMTVLMQNVEELRLMAGAEQNEAIKFNCNQLADIASGMVAGFQGQIHKLMLMQNVVQPVTPEDFRALKRCPSCKKLWRGHEGACVNCGHGHK